MNFAYQQGFHWGTTMSVGFNNNRTTTNQPFSLLTPSLGTNFRFTLSQPLLQGFGLLPNTRFIRIAKNNREISDVAFRLQVITTVTQIQNIYWDLVNAYENVITQQEALGLAQKTLSDNQKQVQIGTLAPIEIVRAQSVVATDQQALTVARTNLEFAGAPRAADVDLGGGFGEREIARAEPYRQVLDTEICAADPGRPDTR